MVHFIVSDPKCPITNSAGIYPHNGLYFTRCHPSKVDKVQQGLQGISGNYVPVFNVSDWVQQADKLFFGDK